MIGGGAFHLRAGQWTDDTSMALCLAASLVERGWDPRDQIERSVRLWREGYMSSTGECFDLENTVRTELARFEPTGKPFSGSSDPCPAGNGSLMRLAPVAMFFAAKPEEAIEKAGESSRDARGRDRRGRLPVLRRAAGLRTEWRLQRATAGAAPQPMPGLLEAPRPAS